MIANNEIVTCIIVLLIGYLLGSIPSAYLFTRLATGKDIRRMGGGNVGGINTYREAGVLPAIGVGIFDVGKGVAAVAIAHWSLHLDKPYLLLAALAVVIGHNWMVWLKFSGGKGMGTSMGALFVLMPLFGYWPGILIFLGIILVGSLITRNLALANGIALLALPFIGWLGVQSGLFIIWSVALDIIITLKFAPTAISVIRQSTDIKDFIRGH